VGRTIQKQHTDTTMVDDGDDVTPDSVRERPLSERTPYRTDAGRVVYGGGGITPDLIVSNQDSTDGMLAFWRLLGPDIPRFRDALTQHALDLKASNAITSPNFTVTPQMRESFWQRLQRRGIGLDRAHFDEVSEQVSRLLGYEITRYVFGSEAEFRRRMRDDRVIAEALELSQAAPTQRQLLSRVAELRAAHHEDVPRTP
jgi:carboxyl-terminal processing protease